MVWVVLALPLVSFAVSLPVTALLIRLGHRLGALDTPGATGHDKGRLRSVPNVGGIAIFLGVLLPALAGIAAVLVLDTETWRSWLPALETHLPRLRHGSDDTRSSISTAAALLACLAALHLVGLIDDRRGLGPGPKLVVQFLAASVMVIWFDVRLLTLLGVVPSVLVTILWFVVITNAINFLDNMDGLAAGVSAIASALFMAAAIVNHQWFIAAMLATLVGALVGFLVFNFPPARVFMGDGGSLVVGFLLAALTVRTTFYYPPTQPETAFGTAWYGLFMPLVVLAIPLYDFATVTAIRLRQGKSPFVGDLQHFSHRLVERGLSRRGAVLVIWGLTAVTGIGGVSLGALAPWQAALVGVQTFLVLMVIALFEHASRHAARERGR